MLKLDMITAEIMEKGIELGYIVKYDYFEDEVAAEEKDFWWFDELNCWVNIDEVNALIDEE